MLERPTGRSSPVATPVEPFARRHIGPDDADIAQMLEVVGARSLEDLIEQTVPESIRLGRDLDLGGGLGEHEALEALRRMASRNRVFRSCIGLGYHGCVTPAVIQRTILENPAWYTQYTPYQAEISQGRLEALLNFQTLVADLTGLPLAGASLLDEGTAAAEGMAMCVAIGGGARRRFVIADDCHPQTIGVVRTRAESLGVELEVVARADLAGRSVGDGLAGVCVQYPTTDGIVDDYAPLAEAVHRAGGLLVVAADPLALTLLRPPGEFGADIAVGSMQRFGVPMGFGGPHAGYLATREEYVRRVPGRIIGVSRDARGRPAYRMAIQTREQHIRRERATSNICTAQALLAIVAGMYAVYHGPDGLRRIAQRVHALTGALLAGLESQGHRRVGTGPFFDTIRVRPRDGGAGGVLERARAQRINLRDFGDGTVGITLDETADAALVEDLLAAFGAGAPGVGVEGLAGQAQARGLDSLGALARSGPILTHPVFHRYRSETELMRYIRRLEGRDLSLVHSMIPLGSCTMKLNAASEMVPISWPEFADLHPFAPADQWEGYAELFASLEAWLAEITGFAAVSLQPNAGSQGEYAGLLAIRAYHRSRGEPQRDVCLIPTSAHGTNPASAVIAGYRVVAVACDARGNIDVEDLRSKASEHADRLGALMVTYPSTHGVFEEAIRTICAIVHEHGGQVYMDGANMNAQVGLCRPADIGADVCHLNLHKTFCIPHGGGGPGMGPIGVAQHLAPFLPGHPVIPPAQTLASARKDRGVEGVGTGGVGPVASAPFGSAGILPISWMYIAMMGAKGLRRASEVAILNANYMAARLRGHYDVLYEGAHGRVAHEFIIDCRAFDRSAGVKVDDIAKRLMDYGFHAPTMSFPVPGTLMIEPTESESKAELDRYCDALIAIREEIARIERGEWPRDDNPLRNAPHTIEMVAQDEWTHPYPRAVAAFPAPWLAEAKFWPCVARIDNPYGDRHLVCTCPPMSDHQP